MKTLAGVSGSTVRKELSLLSAACNYVRRELEWDVTNPTTGRMPKEPPGRIRWITRAEADELVRAAGQIDQAPLLPEFIQLGLNTGMRPGEMLRLEWRRVRVRSETEDWGAWNYCDTAVETDVANGFQVTDELEGAP